MTSNLKDKTAEAASLRVDVEKLRVRTSFCRVKLSLCLSAK